MPNKGNIIFFNNERLKDKIIGSYNIASTLWVDAIQSNIRMYK
jgi:hypothetical protein